MGVEFSKRQQTMMMPWWWRGCIRVDLKEGDRISIKRKRYLQLFLLIHVPVLQKLVTPLRDTRVQVRATRKEPSPYSTQRERLQLPSCEPATAQLRAS